MCTCVRVSVGHVIIDDPAGMSVAHKLGALEAGKRHNDHIPAAPPIPISPCSPLTLVSFLGSGLGLPSVMLFSRKGMPPITVMAGTLEEAANILQKVRAIVSPRVSLSQSPLSNTHILGGVGKGHREICRFCCVEYVCSTNSPYMHSSVLRVEGDRGYK
jgi:hypothetical protein